MLLTLIGRAFSFSVLLDEPLLISSYKGGILLHPHLKSFIAFVNKAMLASKEPWHILESAELCALRALVPHMSCTLRAIVHYVSRALHTLVPLIPPALRAFVCHRRGVPSAFLPYTPRALRASRAPRASWCKCYCASHVLWSSSSRASRAPYLVYSCASRASYIFFKLKPL